MFISSGALCSPVKIVYRMGGTDRTIRCDSYEAFPEELVCYDAEDEFVASIPREAVVAIEAEAV